MDYTKSTEKPKDYTFRLIDFNVVNKIDENDFNEDDDDENCFSSNSNNTLFVIQMFGINEKRETATINITNFKPYFYLKVDSKWNETTLNSFLDLIKTKVGKNYINGFYEHKLVNKKKLYGFDGGLTHKFIYISFNNLTTFNRVKNFWYTSFDDLGNEDQDQEKNIWKLNPKGFVFNLTKIELYEANIPPLLRFFHIKEISPSGWIELPYSKTLAIKNKTTHCDYELSIDFNFVKPLNNKELRVPYKICSFDIEASSSHGDFPIPKKSYKKLAQNIVDYFIDNVKEKMLNEEYSNIFRNLVLTAFGFSSVPNLHQGQDVKTPANENTEPLFCSNYFPNIDLVYPKEKNISEGYLMENITFILNNTIENILLNGNNKEIINIESSFTIKDDDEDEKCVNWFYKTNNVKVKNCQLISLLLNDNLERDYKIVELNKILTITLPQLEGDKVTFIGSTFLNFGETQPYYSNCIVLNTCDKLSNEIDIESYDTEKQVLLAWTTLIQKEDPDIIIGYNIFGFDYQFMFHRADECNCLEDFLKLSRNKDEVCCTEKNGKYKLDELTIHIASGTHELKYIKMNGRVQIDLYNYFRREENLSSYKLDYVAGYFIGDYIKKIEYENNYSLVHTNNFTGLTEGSYLHFEEIGYSTEYYNGGEKFKIDKIINTENEKYIRIEGIIMPDASKKIRWCLAKDDVTPKDIFNMTNGPNSSSSTRFIIGKYCIQDCNLVHYLLNKTDVITGIVEMASICSVPIGFIIFRGQGIKLTSYVAKKCREKGTLMPVITKGSTNDAFEGAMVLEPKCDLYLDLPIPVGDFASLYPSSMISENLSHDSKVWSKEYDLCGNILNEKGEKDENNNFKYDNMENYKYVDIRFDTFKYIRKTEKSKAEKVISGYKICRYAQFPNSEKAIMPSILEELLKARKATKKLIPLQEDEFMKNVYDKRQQAYKITANSLYGQCGAKTSTFYEQDVAAATTATGRLLLTYAKKIVEECYGDIERETKYGIVKSKAEYVYGDTDSVFFTFNLQDMEGEKIVGKKALEISIELAQEATHLVSKFLKQPHDFEYEKTFFPLLLLSKKKYVGMLYELDPTKCKRKEMGIVLKRRDNAPIVKDIYGGVIDILMKEQNINKAINFLNEFLNSIIEEKFPIEKLIITKSLNSNYKNPKQIAHKVLADRITSRDPGNKPSVGDRIPFVYIHTKNKKALQGEKIETPNYIKEKKLKINYSFYISNQIMNPVQQVFALVLEKIWFSQNKLGKIKNFKKLVENLKKTCDPNKLHDELDKLRNKEIKILLFDKYLVETENINNNNQSIKSFFSKKSS